MSGKVPDINNAMDNLFGEGVVKCLDGLDMTFTYLIGDEEIVGFIREIIDRDLLPRPASVGINVVLDDNSDAWGFGDNFENFGNGNFNDGVIYNGV